MPHIHVHQRRAGVVVRALGRDDGDARGGLQAPQRQRTAHAGDAIAEDNEVHRPEKRGEWGDSSNVSGRRLASTWARLSLSKQYAYGQ